MKWIALIAILVLAGCIPLASTGVKFAPRGTEFLVYDDGAGGYTLVPSTPTAQPIGTVQGGGLGQDIGDASGHPAGGWAGWLFGLAGTGVAVAAGARVASKSKLVIDTFSRAFELAPPEMKQALKERARQLGISWLFEKLAAEREKEKPPKLPET